MCPITETCDLILRLLLRLLATVFGETPPILDMRLLLLPRLDVQHLPVADVLLEGVRILLLLLLLFLFLVLVLVLGRLRRAALLCGD